MRWNCRGRADLPAGRQPEYLPHAARSRRLITTNTTWASSRKLDAHGAVRIDYVGTRGLHEPYQVGLNGYQTVCAGCFAPYPYQQPLDQRFGSVNEFRTDASSNYSGLQTSLTEQFRSLTLNANYTFSHCLDEVSNGGLLPFSTQGILTPLPGELSSQYSNCDYDVRHNLSAFGIYQIPFASKHLLLRALFSNWSFSETAFLHSGLPFTVLSQPYTANGNGVFQASGPQFARRVPGVPLYQKTPVSGVTVAGTRQWLNPNAFVSVVDPTTGACTGVALARRHARPLPVWRLRPQHRARPAFH